MEFFSHFANAFSDGIDSVVAVFSGMFAYFRSIGVREETLIIILIGGGISFLLMLVALFMLMAKIKLKRGHLDTSMPKKTQKTAQKTGKNTTRFSAMFSPKARASVDDAPLEKVEAPKAEEKTLGKGFSIFKKRKTPSRLDRNTNRPDTKVAPPVDAVLSQLAEIERDMLALKELYQAGHIKVDVYVSESRTLYEKAKALN